MLAVTLKMPVTLLPVTLHLRVPQSIQLFHTGAGQNHPRSAQTHTVTLKPPGPQLFKSLCIAACHNSSSEYAPVGATILAVTLHPLRTQLLLSLHTLRVSISLQLN